MRLARALWTLRCSHGPIDVLVNNAGIQRTRGVRRHARRMLELQLREIAINPRRCRRVGTRLVLPGQHARR
ncbi:MAG: hypothetical protein H6726_17555 [Sandaracinaceae bacterium]|nr:hypothetical protein [Sandaracinaceae bacterium]